MSFMNEYFYGPTQSLTKAAARLCMTTNRWFRQYAFILKDKPMWYQPDRTLRSEQKGRHFANEIFNALSSVKIVIILITFSLKFVRRGAIGIQMYHHCLFVCLLVVFFMVIVWRRTGTKPLPESVMTQLTYANMHQKVTMTHWTEVKRNQFGQRYFMVWPEAKNSTNKSDYFSTHFVKFMNSLPPWNILFCGVKAFKACCLSPPIYIRQ